ncbi:MAG TPA: polysaccharide deacetylase family protein [Candidatus Omnitrophota bacterium]|nr:polysaccharide deacetylase family protein [Candidatus Omnitrophota bacterium]
MKLLPFQYGSYLPILMYHFIDGQGERESLSVSLPVFEKHLRYLADNGFRVLSLETFVGMRLTNSKISCPAAAITFDDGDQAFFLKVYPLLEKYRMPATVFVIADRIGKKGFLGWPEMRQMREDLVTIGSHGLSHDYLPDLAPEDSRKEIFESKRVLEEGLRREVELFSYPVGGFNAQIAGFVKEAGYLAACTTNRGRNFNHRDLFRLKRIKMTEKTLSPLALAGKLSGLYLIPTEFSAEPCC